MESTIEHRPKMKIGFFGRFRTQLLTVFLVMVTVIVIIGLLSIYSQTQARRTAERLISVDARIVQSALIIQANLAVMDRLEEQFLDSVRSPENVESAIAEFSEPWFVLEETVHDQFEELATLRTNQITTIEGDLIALSESQLERAEEAFVQIIDSHILRTRLVASMSSAAMLDLRFNSAELVNFQIDNQTLNNLLRDYLLTGDEVHVDSYIQLIDRMLPSLEAIDLTEQEKTLITDVLNANMIVFNRLRLLDQDIALQQSIYSTASSSNSELVNLVIDDTLNDQAQQQEMLAQLNRNTLLSIAGLVIASIAAAFIYLTTGGGLTIRQVEDLKSTITLIQNGDYQARANVISNDETGVVAQQMNNMLDLTFSLIQSREEQAAIQDSIFALMEDVSLVADGDLTVRARGTHKLTRPIAQAFNETIAQLHDVISQIQTTTVDVGEATSNIQVTAEQLTNGSESQSAHIIDTSAAVDEMSISIQHVSENSLQSSAVSAQALSNAKLGTAAVNQTIAGMARIQAEVEQSAGQIKRVDKSSKDISQTIRLIDELADRTSVLALNATIRALAAGKDGRGFAVVAREIEDLAEQAVQATQRVDQLATQMQTDAAEALDAMTLTQTSVSASLETAQNATTRLTDIEHVATRLSDIIRDISHAASQQARSSETVAQSMNEIAQVTKQTASGTREAMSSIGGLIQLAEDLSDSIAIFKLQNDNDSFFDSAQSQLAAGD